jgi:hypothetical protein
MMEDYMKGNIIVIPYTKLIKANRKHIIIALDDEETKKLLVDLVDSLNRKDKTVELPEWYARKETLI